MKKLLVAALLCILALGCVCAHAEADHTCSGGKATCDDRAICGVCGQPYGRLADHDWGAWVSDGDSTHTRTCRTNAGHKETRYHSGSASTCTAGAKCVYCGAVHDAPLGHVSASYPGYPPTCTSSGATDGVVCSRCGDTLTPRQTIRATGHSFSAWQPLSDGLHVALCQTCGFSAEVSCTPFAFLREEETHAICPICGACGDTALPMLISRADAALPMGQLMVRGAADVIPGTLYAITVSGSYTGNVTHLNGETVVTLPDDLSALPAFRLVYVDFSADGIQALSAVPFSMADGRLTFTADKVGLYLLLAAE